MVSIRGGKRKVKFGLLPIRTPKFHNEPTDDATIPMWHSDGTLKYINSTDMQWMIDNNKIEDLKPDLKSDLSE